MVRREEHGRAGRAVHEADIGAQITHGAIPASGIAGLVPGYPFIGQSGADAVQAGRALDHPLAQQRCPFAAEWPCPGCFEDARERSRHRQWRRGIPQLVRRDEIQRRFPSVEPRIFIAKAAPEGCERFGAAQPVEQDIRSEVVRYGLRRAGEFEQACAFGHTRAGERRMEDQVLFRPAGALGEVDRSGAFLGQCKCRERGLEGRREREPFITAVLDNSLRIRIEKGNAEASAKITLDDPDHGGDAPFAALVDRDARERR